jgi:hypothetical protein
MRISAVSDCKMAAVVYRVGHESEKAGHTLAGQCDLYVYDDCSA